MIAVIFEVIPRQGAKQEYLDLAAQLRPTRKARRLHLDRALAACLTKEDLSLSFLARRGRGERCETLAGHREAQARGRGGVFAIPAARRGRDPDYGMNERKQAPQDSRSSALWLRQAQLDPRSRLNPLEIRDQVVDALQPGVDAEATVLVRPLGRRCAPRAVEGHGERLESAP